jgi:hypothetical protein
MTRIYWLATSVLAIAACAGTARRPTAYRDDTGKLLETRSAQLQSCYSDALKSDAKLSGTVTVQFVVEKNTGMVSQASVDQSKSTAPAVLGDCVVKAIDGLTLAPPDRNEGRATFVYEFKPNPAPTS